MQWSTHWITHKRSLTNETRQSRYSGYVRLPVLQPDSDSAVLFWGDFMSHTQGKLRLCQGNKIRPSEYSEDGFTFGYAPLAVVKGDKRFGEEKNTANARRLVACWNAADGIPTAELEAAADGRLLNIFEGLIRERDELLDALTHAVEIAEAKRSGTWDDLLQYRAAIARVKGGEA